MTGSRIPSEVEALSVAERILLVEEIWNSIAEEQEAVEVTPAQREELDRRLEAHRAAPGEGTSWEEVKRRLDASM